MEFILCNDYFFMVTIFRYYIEYTKLNGQNKKIGKVKFKEIKLLEYMQLT